jgi:hypothetical protein
LDILQSTVRALNRTVYQKNDHIADLKAVIDKQEAALAAKNAEIARQARLIRRIESGRVMRLLNRFTRRR